MKSIPPDARVTLEEKKAALEMAKLQLRKEFIGIDKPIDDLIESFGYWYFFPELQNRPVIINLWGLTGVGKTSLVTRLMELIGLHKRFYRFNLSDNEWDIRSTLLDIFDNRAETDIAILLDEFQYVRSIREDKTEKATRHQFIWDLLDSGRIPVNNFHMRISELSGLVIRLNRLLQIGVIVENGKVVSGEDIYRRETNYIDSETAFSYGTGSKTRKSESLFVPRYYHDVIHDHCRETYPLLSDVAQALLTMNGSETIAFLYKTIKNGLASKHLDCSRSIVFIIGNLDEAYEMAGNFDTDIDADDFHAESLKISLPVIKEALRNRFRSEQIARLGNNHIIYPALDSAAYRRIIDLELGKLADDFSKTSGVRVSFDSSVKKLLYDEGVFPTQGTRPLISTIRNIVSAQFPKILFRILNKTPLTRSVDISRDGEMLRFRLCSGKKCLDEFAEKVALSLENLREPTNDDVQAVTAVHESGHAIISVALLKIVPEIVCSVSTRPDNKGFIFSRNRPEFIARREITSRIAVLLGGYAAEKLVFGEDNLTTGASSDISQATQMVCGLLKSCGMGSLPAAFNNQDSLTRHYIYDTDNSLNDHAKRVIADALALAESTLTEHFSLLVSMGSYLSSNRSLRKEEIISMVEAVYGRSGIAAGLREEPPSFYRSRLEDLARKDSLHKMKEKPAKREFGYSLNRD